MNMLTSQGGSRILLTGIIQGQRRQLRLYHASAKREIVPLLAVGTLFLVGRYSWKALNRMDEEWEDYLWELQQWEAKQARQGAHEIPTTIGVDLGTIYTKLAATATHQRQATLQESTTGERLRLIGLSSPTEGEEEPSIVPSGPFLDKFFYPTKKSADAKSSVQLLYQMLSQHTDAPSNAMDLLRKVVVPPLVQQVLDKNNWDPKKQDTALRQVLTLPPNLYPTFAQALSDDKEWLTVPDPVAALWGAQALDLIKTPTEKAESCTTLVVDLGGLQSSISLLDHSKILATATLPNVGGESLVQVLVEKILSEVALETSFALDQDPVSLALIAKAARQAVLELTTKKQATIDIPYLFMGRQQDNPHFTMSISRSVLEQMVQDQWRNEVIPSLLYGGGRDTNKVLADSLPPPTDLTSLLCSATTKLLEDANIGWPPQEHLDHVLVVGGASRFSFVQAAVEQGIRNQLLGGAGGSDACRWVCPEPVVRTELAALGAASLLPNYTYHWENGLHRFDDTSS